MVLRIISNVIAAETPIANEYINGIGQRFSPWKLQIWTCVYFFINPTMPQQLDLAHTQQTCGTTHHWEELRYAEKSEEGNLYPPNLA